MFTKKLNIEKSISLVMAQNCQSCGKQINHLSHFEGRDGLLYCSECVKEANNRFNEKQNGLIEQNTTSESASTNGSLQPIIQIPKYISWIATVWKGIGYLMFFAGIFFFLTSVTYDLVFAVIYGGFAFIVGLIYYSVGKKIKNGSKWVWWYYMITSSLGVITGLFALPIGILNIGIGAIFLYYFTRPHVKAFFGKQ